MGHGLAKALLVVAAGSLLAQPARAERWSLPDWNLGRRTQPLLLLTRDDVRADLGLSARQADEVDKAVLEFVPRAAALHGMPPGPAAVEARREIDVDAQHWLENHLTGDQYQRLVQVDLQWEGPSSLISRAVIADTLNLTINQKKRLVQALAARNKKRPPRTFSQEVERAFTEQARAILTPEQQHLWITMVGRPFTPRLAGNASPPAR